jgi:hypothetical protein
MPELSRSAVSQLLPPITVNGIRYRVLRLEGGSGLRFLLRSDDGELFGVCLWAQRASRALGCAA